MAQGIGWILGFQIPRNFAYPYQSLTMTEFWRRWHITLGKWFRDYVYIPLGGNQKALSLWCAIYSPCGFWLVSGMALTGIFFSGVFCFCSDLYWKNGTGTYLKPFSSRGAPVYGSCDSFKLAGLCHFTAATDPYLFTEALSVFHSPGTYTWFEETIWNTAASMGCLFLQAWFLWPICQGGSTAGTAAVFWLPLYL